MGCTSPTAHGTAGDVLHADSPFSALAAAWLEDLSLDVDRAESKGRLRACAPTLGDARVGEFHRAGIDRGPDRSLPEGAAREVLFAGQAIAHDPLLLGFAVRRGVIAANPVKDIARMKRPKRIPKALTERRRAHQLMAAGGRVPVDVAEEAAELADVGVFAQDFSSDVPESEAWLLLGRCVLADVVVGYRSLLGHHAQAVGGVGRVCRDRSGGSEYEE